MSRQFTKKEEFIFDALADLMVVKEAEMNKGFTNVHTHLDSAKGEITDGIMSLEQKIDKRFDELMKAYVQSNKPQAPQPQAPQAPQQPVHQSQPQTYTPQTFVPQIPQYQLPVKCDGCGYSIKSRYVVEYCHSRPGIPGVFCGVCQTKRGYKYMPTSASSIAETPTAYQAQSRAQAPTITVKCSYCKNNMVVKAKQNLSPEQTVAEAYRNALAKGYNGLICKTCYTEAQTVRETPSPQYEAPQYEAPSYHSPRAEAEKYQAEENSDRVEANKIKGAIVALRSLGYSYDAIEELKIKEVRAIFKENKLDDSGALKDGNVWNVRKKTVIAMLVAEEKLHTKQEEKQEEPEETEESVDSMLNRCLQSNAPDGFTSTGGFTSAKNIPSIGQTMGGLFGDEDIF